MPSNSRRSRLWIALALALAAAALALTAFGSGGPESQRILVAADSLERGAEIRDALLDGRAEWRAIAGGGALEGLLRESDALDDLRIAVPLESGEPISRAALGGSAELPTLDAGERLISLPLSSAGAVAGALSVGGRVDVVSTVAEGPLGAAALVADDAEVVTIDADPGTVGQGTGGVLVRVAHDEALTISEALGAGRDLRLIVRPARGRP